MLCIKNINIVLENGILWDGYLVTQDGIITDFGQMRDLSVPTGTEVIDGKGLYLGPGFVDIHVHGGDQYSTCLEPIEAATCI